MTAAPPVPHMSPDEFRVLGTRMVNFIADYWEHVHERPVLSRVRPGDVLGALPMRPPERGEDDVWNAIFRDLERDILPALTHWQSPNFFGFFPANASFPAILGEMLSAGLGVQGMLWATSPACTELEMRVLDWVAEMLGLPAQFHFESRSQREGTESECASLRDAARGRQEPAGTSAAPRTGSGGGVIQGTASEATLTALVAARHRSLAGASGSSGGDSPRLIAYASTQAHSSFIKACMIAGLARDAEDRTHVRLIETDSAYAMRPDVLERAMREDLSDGCLPFFVMPTLGTTSSTAMDPVVGVSDAIDRAFAGSALPRPWIHVDAAHAGSLAILPEQRGPFAGLDRCDSFCFNPHKWLLVNFDCDCFYVRDRAALVSAMSLTPEYLRNAASQSGSVIDYRDWHVPLGRRFRALKLWFVIRHYGVDGLRAHVREHLRLAALFESLLTGDDRFELAAPRSCNLVCFRLRARPGESPAETDVRNKALLDVLNASGELYLTHTVLPKRAERDEAPRLVLRMAIGATLTREEHVRRAWSVIQARA